MSTLTHDQARQVLEAALHRAEENGSLFSVAVLDGGRELMAFGRQTDASLASTDISISKAYTAGSMGMNTGDLMPLVQPGGPLYGVERTQARPFVAFAGGRPLTVKGEIVAAVGATGGTAEQDDQVASAGVAALPQN